ncbi:MAG: hypothetical protein J0L92_40725, partial [Deltaproteobacteria bacterium]|nr:hypothetical protein [Deltaproteobacteria bacterium]
RVGNRLTEGYTLANLGRALAAQGRAREAREAIEQASALARQMKDAHLASAAALYACRLDPIAADADTLAALLRDPSPTVRASAHVIEAERAVAADRAITHVDEALTIADDGLEEGEIEIRAAAARLLDRHSLTERATQARTRAEERLSELATRITDADTRDAFVARARVVIRS